MILIIGGGQEEDVNKEGMEQNERRRGEKEPGEAGQEGGGLPQFLRLFFHCEASILHPHMEIFLLFPCGFPLYLVLLYMFSQTGLCYTKYILISKLLEKKEE